jgi:hypothetical protein
VLAYETASLCVFCRYDGFWMTSLVAFDVWFSHLLMATIDILTA